MACCCGGNNSSPASGAVVSGTVPAWQQNQFGRLADEVSGFLQGLNLKTVFWTAVIVLGIYWALED